MEKVKKLGIKREKGRLYFLRAGAVYAVKRGEKGSEKKIADAAVTREKGWLYFIDGDGDISRSRMKR